MIVPCYRVTIPGNPGPAAVNARAKPVVRNGHATMVLEPGYRSWRDLAIILMRRAAAAHPDPAWLATLRTGPLDVRVEAYWDRQHGKGPSEGLAYGDVDAVVKACLDALQLPRPATKRSPARPGAGIISSDGQAKCAWLEKHYDKDIPKIEITVWKYRANCAS